MRANRSHTAFRDPERVALVVARRRAEKTSRPDARARLSVTGREFSLKLLLLSPEGSVAPDLVGALLMIDGLGNISSLLSSLGIGATSRAPVDATQTALEAFDRGVAMREIADALSELRDLRELLGGPSSSGSALPYEHIPVPLSTSASATRLASSGDVGVSRTIFAGDSAARTRGSVDSGLELRLYGRYGGAGSGAIEIRTDRMEVDRTLGITGRNGRGAASLRLTTTSGAEFNLEIAEGTAVGSRIRLTGDPELEGLELEIGLQERVAFAESRNGRLEWDVQSGEVDLDARLTRAGEAPRFAEGSVEDGRFEIDGVSIRVRGSSTLRSVLDDITSSVPGVTASWDDARRAVTLTRDDASDAPIVLGRDDAGFFAALRLDEREQELGQASELDQAIANVAVLANVQSGSIDVDGVAVAVDRERQSVSQVLTAIEASRAGITARYDSAQGRVLVEGASEVRDRSGTFAAVLIGQGAPTSKNADAIFGKDVMSRVAGIAQTLERATARLGSRVGTSIQSALGAEGSKSLAAMGIEFKGESGKLELSRGGDGIRSAFSKNRRQSTAALIGRGGEDRGALGKIEAALRALANEEARAAGTTVGVLLSSYA